MRFKNVLMALIILIFSGCQVKIEPVLSSSLGMSAFENMKKIQLRDASVALYLDDKIKNLKVERQIKQGTYTFPVGSSLSVKLIKVLTYTFKTVHLLDSPVYKGSEKIDAIMKVTLQDVDVNLGVEAGFSTVSSTAYSRFVVRAEIRDAETGNVVWVGTSQSQSEGTHSESNMMTYQEAGRGFAEGMDVAVDQVVGNLIHQMGKSSSLASNLDRWEQN